MGKILKTILVLLFSTTLGLYANTYQNELSRFDREHKTATTDEMLKFHHALKNIYIQSIIKNNKNLKISALQRLVITSSRLGLKSNAYQKELETLGKISKKKIHIPKPKPTKSSKTPNKKLDAKKLFATKAQSQKELKKKIQQGAKKGSNARIIETASNDKQVVITFDRKIGDIELRTFALKGKKAYRYVYDFGAILNGGARSIDFKKAQRVRIGQYNKKTVRLVFTSKNPLKLYYSKINNKIQVGFKGSSSKPLITTKTPKSKSTASKPKTTQKKRTTPKTNSFNASSKVIVIDPGHGGKDGGARGAGKLLEKREVLKIALKLGRDLKKRGFKVYYTRVKDKFIRLRTRTKMANDKKADLFISLHANAAPNKTKAKKMQGIETFFLSPARSKRSKNVAALENKSDIAEMDFFSKQTFLNFLNREKIISSNKLALDVQQGMLNALRKHYKIVDGGVREAPFWVLVGAQMPAILVEVGYISHKVEGKRIASSKYQTRVAKGIADGIDAYFAKNF